jgi:PPK2 family polyphosphate:nucleotide phosphotransferase
MDTAGKDGAIKHIMSGVNPQGCQVMSFKHPEQSELEHDFLWRTTRSLPDRGRIGIFNRSYYEEVLIVRVHPELLKSERLPNLPKNADKIWKQRYRSIRDLEQHLTRNGTRILKFFLHISKEEQKRRFIARLEDAKKNWKFSDADITERGYWSEYMRVYESCLSKTSRKSAPWFVIPADDKENARLIISDIIVKNLQKLHLAYPVTSPDEHARLMRLRSKLENEAS